jgi:hypothetical protein
METITLTRVELYNMVWLTPMLTLSKKYSISDVGLRKMCKRMNIPVPKAGHWAKVRVGKPVRILKLPSDFSGDNEVTLKIRSQDGTDSQHHIMERKQLLAQIMNDPSLPLTVPDRLTNPDKMVIAARKSLIKEKRNYTHYKGIVHTVNGELNIRVSPANIDRALIFFDTLIKLVRARGHKLEILGYKTYAIIDEQQIEVRIVEKAKMVKIDDRWGSTQFHPSGILTFRFERFLKDEWISGSKPLEEQLPSILVKLEIEAQRAKEEHRQIDEWHQQQEEKKRLKEEHKQRIEKEWSDFKELIKQAKRLQRVTFLRQYLDVVEKRAKTEGKIDDHFVHWIEWARAKADWYDPLLNREDELLGFFELKKK